MQPKERPDRLSALVSRFALDVRAEPLVSANLAICTSDGETTPRRVVFTPTGTLSESDCAATPALFTANVDWGGTDNPLVRALPTKIDISIVDDPEMQNLAALLVAETLAQRCGSGSVINRLGEVLMVRLLRSQLSAGTTDVGLLGGLADARLSHAIVAMHETPGRQWRIEQLAELSGLSVSRFADRFAKTVGVTPMAYLRHWRMILARQDVDQGERIQTVARRYGYASAEALSRAFKKTYGNSPTLLRNSPVATIQAVE
ncbi:MAG: AraC family transcriptional regulator [Gammaproteobacteria bacterium]|nr:AraC family transcriptional regulator [Gammaproteobacteria bacterium]